MSTAITNFGKAYGGYQVKSAKTKKAVQFVKTESRKTKLLRAAKKTFFYGSVLSVLLTIAAVGAFFYFYNQYAAIVDSRSLMYGA